MKTPWSELLEYGIGVTVLIVISFAGVILLTVVGVVVVITKILVFIK